MAVIYGFHLCYNLVMVFTNRTTDIYVRILQLFIAVIPFITGVFYEWQSAIVSLFLVVMIVVALVTRRVLVIRSKTVLIMALLIPLFYLLSYFWAVDSGMALLGFVKFLPLPLFVLAIDQTGEIRPLQLLRFLPYSGAVMTLISIPLTFFESMKGHIFVRGRFGGFFEYPNVYAMFLLVGIMIVLSSDKLMIREWIMMTILTAGIVLSGSRAVIVLAVFYAFYIVFTVKERKVKIIILASMGSVLISLAILYLIIGNNGSVTRIFTSITENSTLKGRLLYYCDALPVILKNPFGLGYYGYYYTQGAFQTGVYSVIHVHNDLLQVFLDIGLIPGIAVIASFIRALIKADKKIRVMLIFIALHMVFDLDMQFLAFALAAISLMCKQEKEIRSYSHILRYAVSIVSAVLCLGSLYFGISSFLGYCGNYKSALSMHPGYTEIQNKLLTTDRDDASLEQIADSILARNANASLANNAKARIAFAEGDIKRMIDYKEKAIGYSKYSKDEYVDYLEMLRISIALYLQNNDYNSAEYCIERALSIPDKMQKVLDNTSSLGMAIDDKPDLELPDDYKGFIEDLKSMLGK